MSFKELISSLIAPISARPQAGIYQKITVTGDGENHNFTMPIDGWVSLVGQNNNVGSEMTSCFLWGDAGSEVPTASGSIIAQPGYTVQGLGFFRKGQPVFYNIVGFSICEARIFALVGGGYLSYFATFGGGLCLRLNHFLSRFSSSLVGKRSPAVNTKVLAKRLTTIGVKNTLPPLTATSSFLEITSSLYKLVTLPEAFRYVRNVILPLVQCFPLRKVKYSTHQLATRVQPCLFTDSIRALAQPNLCFEGGAL